MLKFILRFRFGLSQQIRVPSEYLRHPIIQLEGTSSTPYRKTNSGTVRVPTKSLQGLRISIVVSIERPDLFSQSQKVLSIESSILSVINTYLKEKL